MRPPHLSRSGQQEQLNTSGYVRLVFRRIKRTRSACATWRRARPTINNLANSGCRYCAPAVTAIIARAGIKVDEVPMVKQISPSSRQRPPRSLLRSSVITLRSPLPALNKWLTAASCAPPRRYFHMSSNFPRCQQYCRCRRRNGNSECSVPIHLYLTRQWYADPGLVIAGVPGRPRRVPPDARFPVPNALREGQAVRCRGSAAPTEAAPSAGRRLPTGRRKYRSLPTAHCACVREYGQATGYWLLAGGRDPTLGGGGILCGTRLGSGRLHGSGLKVTRDPGVMFLLR